MDIEDLRAIMDERAEEDDGLTCDVKVLLKKGLRRKRDDLIAEQITANKGLEGTMAEGGADTADTDAELAKIDAEIEASTITLRFRALMEPDYREVQRRHPDGQKEAGSAQDDFLADLADQCLYGITGPDGKPLTGFDKMKPGEWRKHLIAAEMDEVGVYVWNLNKNQNPLPRPKL